MVYVYIRYMYTNIYIYMIICIVYPQIYTIIISYCLIGWIYNLGITAKNNRHLLLSLHVYQEFNSSNVRIHKSVLEALFPRHFVAVEHRQLHLLPLCTSGNSIQVSRSFEFCLKFVWNTGSGQKCRRNDGKKGNIETLWTQPLPFFPSLGNFFWQFCTSNQSHWCRKSGIPGSGRETSHHCGAISS